MNKRTNCPNCGAIKKGNVCEYCGTVFKNKNDIRIDVNTAMITKEEYLDILCRMDFVSPANMRKELLTDGVVGMIDGKVLKVSK